jgi:UDP-N-acetylmuramoyl-tripeptide--D-alanyl-D-alanine ligase
MIIEKLHDLFLECRGVSTDTRSLQNNDLFFALKGPNFNANAFAKEALEKGARYAVIIILW